jgi:hypothetical protein
MSIAVSGRSRSYRFHIGALLKNYPLPPRPVVVLEPVLL